VLRRLYGLVGGKPLYKFIGESYVHGMMDGEAFGKKMRPGRSMRCSTFNKYVTDIDPRVH